MTTPPSNVSLLLSRLSDPFLMYPVESVADTLFGAVDEAQGMKFSGMGPYGVSRKYWTVEEEHLHQEEGLLLGAIFVLGQAAITQTNAILNELQRHPAASVQIPAAKEQRMTRHAAVDKASGLSQIVVINAAANYFKHVDEWPEDWAVAAANSNQAQTIGIAQQVGMRPGEIAGNLWIAARLLNLSRENPRALAQCIQGWREAWANILCPAFGCRVAH